ncbi:MAG: hypothetical protein ACLFTR_02320 [Candidatus Woesearchaeota archaeon]
MQEYDTPAEMIDENFDEILEDGKRIRAICDDNDIDIHDFHALLDVHTTMCYTGGVREFYTKRRDIGLKAISMLSESIQALSGDNQNTYDDRDFDKAFADNIGGRIAELQKQSRKARSENFFTGVLEATRQLYESEDFLDRTLDKYFTQILPKMGFYTDEGVERSFEKARERDAQTDKEILSAYGLEDRI